MESRMTTSESKLDRARHLILRDLKDLIVFFKINENAGRIQFQLSDGVKASVQYNDHEEYSYSLFFSLAKDDFCRFVNYDDRWDVLTRPHHFHERGKKSVKDSSMKGDPDVDIPRLCAKIKSGKYIE